MKSISKIFILLGAMLIIAGSFLFYSKTKVEPPIPSEVIDQFIDDLENTNKDIAEANENDAYAVDSKLLIAIEKINIFQQEKKIEDIEADIAYVQIANAYSPKFIRRCYRAFNHEVWSDDDHAYMLYRIYSLSNITKSNGEGILQSSYLKDFDDITQIIANYRDARRISKQSEFVNLDNAKRNIADALEYSNYEYLSNCVDLVQDLNSLKTRIGQSHYRYVLSKVTQLSEFRFLGKEIYMNTLYKDVEEAIDGYRSLHGENSLFKDLQNKTNDYYLQATRYYLLQK